MTEPRPAAQERVRPKSVDQGRTTRSSRWTTSCGQPVLELGGLTPGDPPEHRRGVPDQPFRERHARTVDDLDRVVGVEGALDAPHPGRQQGAVVRAQSAAGTVVDDDPSGRGRGRRRSRASGSRAARPGAGQAVPTARPAMASRHHVGGVGGGDHRPHPGPRGDLRRRQLGGHARRSPARCRCHRRAPRARRRPRRSPR